MIFMENSHGRSDFPGDPAKKIDDPHQKDDSLVIIFRADFTDICKKNNFFGWLFSTESENE
ncbi:hypothetical protein [Caldithrix abyssi]